MWTPVAPCERLDRHALGIPDAGQDRIVDLSEQRKRLALVGGHRALSGEMGMGQDLLPPAQDEGAAVDVAGNGVEGARQVSDLDDRGDGADEGAVAPERRAEVDEGADLA